MAFLLRKEHSKVHNDIKKRRFVERTEKWLNEEYPELFTNLAYPQRLDWTQQAIIKAKKYDFFESEAFTQAFCRIVARIGLDFDQDEHCKWLQGILTNDTEYTCVELIKEMQLSTVNDFLDATGAAAIGTSDNAACHCVIPEELLNKDVQGE